MKPGPLPENPFALPLIALSLSLAAPAVGEIVVFDLDKVPVPTGAQGSILLPYEEDGLRLTANTTSIYITGPISTHYPGRLALVPAPLSSGQDVVVGLHSPSGRPFAVRSVTLHPRPAGTALNVTFTGWLNGNGQLQSQSTGTAISGNTVTFNSNFNRVTALDWRMTRVGGNYQTFQISRVEVEFDGVLSVPDTITVNEAAGTASIPVRLGHPRSVDTQITRQISANSATAPADFTMPGGSGSGSITIPAGQTVGLLQVPLVNDTGTEPLEDFQIVFTAASPGATFANSATSAISTVKIASDDGIANFAGWMSAHGLTGSSALPDADPNGDRVSNIESWLHRINPAGPSPDAWLERRAAYFTTTSNVPGLRLTVPTPLPSDVRLIFEETALLSSWSEQTRRSGFATGSLWTGTGASRVVESNSLAARTITFPGSAGQGARPRAFFRMKYELVTGGGD